ncbi:MAG: sulfatase [Phycisphaerae bacterium]|nr:sulfatase [Phycisphaerae bacterium]
MNIVFVICHDLGQHLGCYGRSDIRSPRIDAFAGSGVRFENSFCTAPQCSPSRAGLWTGRFAHANGVVGLAHGGFGNDLNADETHLVQRLRGSGYETHLFGVQHEAASPERCGYEHIHPVRPCGELADEVCALLGDYEPADGPLFAQVGFFEPHRPFVHEGVEPLAPDHFTIPPYLPDIPEVREDLADIEASICAMDTAFGRIVDAIQASRIADDTLVVFTADHGIAFPQAKLTLYDAGIEVPLIVAGPGLPEGVVRREMISNVDVMPALLELCGLACPSDLHGRSFRPLLDGGDYTENAYVFAEKTYHTYYDPMRAVRSRQWKLVANFEFAPWQETSPDYDNNAKSYVEVAKALNPDEMYHPPLELYDLTGDPHERHNLAADPAHAGKRDELIGVLHAWMQRTGDPLLDGPMAQSAYRRRMEQFKRIAGGA